LLGTELTKKEIKKKLSKVLGREKDNELYLGLSLPILVPEIARHVIRERDPAVLPGLQAGKNGLRYGLYNCDFLAFYYRGGVTRTSL